MMDVLILTKYDWSNTGWRFFKCLQHLGVDVLMLKGSFHPFFYPEQAPIHPLLAQSNGILFHRVPELKWLTEEAKVVHYIASTFIDTGTDFFSKKVVMQHGGKAYRQDPDALNKIYNQFADVTILQSPDLLGYGANDEQWVYYPVDTDFIQPDFKRRSKNLIIGHFPSIPHKKGTDQIVKVIEKLEKNTTLAGRFRYVGARNPDQFEKTGICMWTDNLKRMAGCDIIIETMLPEVQGHKFGEWGNTALEAAAMGKIVVTNSFSSDLYDKEFGRSALKIANNPDALGATLHLILTLSDKGIENLKEESRAWVERNHSIPATANRLFENIYSKLL
jgi:glycosyltransferase involved in cell wall biosynthesis